MTKQCFYCNYPNKDNAAQCINYWMEINKYAVCITLPKTTSAQAKTPAIRASGQGDVTTRIASSKIAGFLAVLHGWLDEGGLAFIICC